MAACLSMLICNPAQAELKLCNDTESRVGVALAYLENGEWVSEGWWNIESGSCEVLLTGELNNDIYYLYAVDYEKGGDWKGSKNICTQKKLFIIRGWFDCKQRGYDEEMFFQVDTEGKSDWTVRLNRESYRPPDAGKPRRSDIHKVLG
jgi:uncharacterized membrane protein